MKRTIFIFTVLILLLLILFQVSKFAVASGDLEIEFVIAGFAILFFFIGIYINKKLLQKKTSSEIEPGELDQQKIESLGISSREYEILQEIAKGYSNKEIADNLFVSENTIKSHVSNLFVKLDVKRRTQAIKKAKDLKLIH